jgi:hypothetical protein
MPPFPASPLDLNNHTPIDVSMIANDFDPGMGTKSFLIMKLS